MSIYVSTLKRNSSCIHSGILTKMLQISLSNYEHRRKAAQLVARIFSNLGCIALFKRKCSVNQICVLAEGGWLNAFLCCLCAVIKIV